MALSGRAREKGMQKASTLLPPETRLRTYAVGRGHGRMTTGAMVAGGIFLAAFVVALALGFILIPGGLLLVFVISEVRPPRAVVITDQGIGVLARSIWTGRPSKVLALLPLVPLRSPSPSGSVVIALGPDRITFSRAEFNAVSAAAELAAAPTASSPPPPPPPPPDPGFPTP